MAAALARHDTLVRGAIETHGGYVFATAGDGFAAAFSRAGDALAAAAAAQVGLSEEQWPAGAAIKVRIGLHTGVAEERGGDYFGPALNRGARLMAIAHGGQVVCSQATAALAGPKAGLRNLGEHRLRDLQAAEVVFQAGDGTFPPLRSVDVVPTNLPTVRTELIGRADDITTISGFVERDALVTLTGAGGVGKTRLALAVAAALAHRFPDGCWVVELAPVTDGKEVVKTVAGAFGASVTDQTSLVAYLADRRMLIVLDNCEHLLADTAELVDAVVATAPDVRLVATTREPLGVDGEKVFRVGSLVVPASDACAEEAAATSAVRLFADRASAASMGFAIEPRNVAAVVDICQRLDGIPLAIELAAARVRAMPPAEIAARLDDRFRILAGGSRRAQERHRTLLATVSWSYDLLSAEEKMVFRRLAVFPSSFDLAAAESAAGGTEPIHVLDAVVSLVDRSLVQYEPDVGRYRLLETLRQYGADRLSESEETEATRARHARHFLALAQAISPELDDARYSTASGRLVRELENLRATAEWCIDGGRWTQLAELALALWVFLFQGAPVDGASWYNHLIANAESLDPQVVVDVLGVMAYLAVESLPDYPYGIALARRSSDLAERTSLEQSPWAWLAISQFGLISTRDHGGLAACEHGLAAALARDDNMAAVIAQGVKACWLAAFGDTAGSKQNSMNALRRAEISGQPVHIQMAVVTAASSVLLQRAAPDLTAGLTVLAGQDQPTQPDAAVGIWLDIMWGLTFVGLHRLEAVGRLVRAIRLADRQSALNAEDLALRLLSVALAEAGHEREADMLTAYSDANLQAHRGFHGCSQWIQDSLDKALAAAPDRAAQQAAGASLSRHDLLTIVSDCEAIIHD
jgi:predicted ATPase